MAVQNYTCPHCRERVRIDDEDGDDVTCECAACAGMFTAGEARRGRLDPDHKIAGTTDAIRELRATVAAHEATIADMRVVLTVQEATIKRLRLCTEPPALQAIKPASTRVRLNHSHTIKEGWRLSETTVEWSGDGLPDEGAIQHALISAANLGQREAALRNAKPAVEEGGEG